MAYLTETTVRQYASYKLRFTESTKSRARVSVFLSHSHKDKDLVVGFINLLAATAQMSIYVDWQDTLWLM